MLKTVDNKGQERFMSLVNFNRLPKNADGSRGSNHIRRVEEVAEDAKINAELDEFIKNKKTITKPAVKEIIAPVVKEEIADEITGQVIEKKEETVAAPIQEKEVAPVKKETVKKVAKPKSKKK